MLQPHAAANRHRVARARAVDNPEPSGVQASPLIRMLVVRRSAAAGGPPPPRRRHEDVEPQAVAALGSAIDRPSGDQRG